MNLARTLRTLLCASVIGYAASLSAGEVSDWIVETGTHYRATPPAGT